MRGYWWCQDCREWIPNTFKKEDHFSKYHRDIFELVVDKFEFDWKRYLGWRNSKE